MKDGTLHLASTMEWPVVRHFVDQASSGIKEQALFTLEILSSFI